jgi:YD repeat-containing protein
MLASLSLNDSPVGYVSPVGPQVRFTATYNQNEANQPATFYYSNLGQYWDFNWLTYVTDNPNSPGADVPLYQSGGGTITYSGYNTNTQTYALEVMSQTILVRTTGSTYEQRFRDGSRRVFGTSDGSTGTSRRIFMTQLIDPAGNAVQMSYDSSLRITNVVDAIGQPTVLGYTNSAYPFAVTSVQDPFGRTAYFTYNASGLLSAITDVLGITSFYLYNQAGLITNLTTPYGTTTFAGGTTNGTTWLQATDPLGGNELAIAPLNPVFSVGNEPAPTNMMVAPVNGYFGYRDTFFWGKQAFEMGAGNPAAATIYHFLHAPNISTESRVLESVKAPLENRVWFNYPGQTVGNILGAQSINRPSAVARVLDDGSSQTSYYQYNSAGNLTNYTDPLGRSFTYVYDTNGVDLLQGFMTSHGNNELQLATTYNAHHRPLTTTDAAGQTTTNTYNAQSQILSMTDPLGG